MNCRQPLKADVTEALALLESIQRFAYEQGFHECGYDPVKRLRDELEAWERRWGNLRWCHSGCGEDQKDYHYFGGPSIGGGGGFL